MSGVQSRVESGMFKWRVFIACSANRFVRGSWILVDEFRLACLHSCSLFLQYESCMSYSPNVHLVSPLITLQ